ncbi:MAG TPA: acyl-CoA dehydrogenase [Steroidobacter sp.]|uniref:acyl-CoA dehydrogenase n=1 Tax=Steroidobacter sp. TaxID=1978227 RepID=UPI002EDB440C
MTSNIINRRDLDFMLAEWLDVAPLFDHEPYQGHSSDTVTAVLDLAEQIATQRFLPHYRAADLNEPHLLEGGEVRVLPEIRAAVHAAAEAGLFGIAFAPELGGTQLPHVVQSATSAILMSANVATAAYMMLTMGNARLISVFGTKQQIATFAEPQIAGRSLGTMCLSEPHAGSSLADIRSRAMPDGEDEYGKRYRISGNKMWISGGDHDITPNIVHLVLAKAPDADGRIAAGVRGISLFIVPKILPDGTRNDVVVSGLNHKMGYRGTTNCLLSFGSGFSRPSGREGAIGYLIGEVGSGLQCMFHMMNEARIGVGLGAAMLGYRGYLQSVQYARERPQGRPLGARSQDQPVMIIEHPDVKRMLLAQKAYAEGALALVLYCARTLDEKSLAGDSDTGRELARRIELLTPVVKTWPSEYGLAANDLAIQVHGGAGYTRDFDVEQLYRDNRLNPIHEGTTGIQALDLLGRKVLRDRGESLRELRSVVSRTVTHGRSVPELSGHASELDRAWQTIEDTVSVLLDLADEPRVLANATPFLSAFGHSIVAWLWLDQACVCAAKLHAASQHDRPYYRGKLRACRFFFEVELPKVYPWLSFAASASDVAAGMCIDEL